MPATDVSICSNERDLRLNLPRSVYRAFALVYSVVIGRATTMPALCHDLTRCVCCIVMVKLRPNQLHGAGRRNPTL